MSSFGPQLEFHVLGGVKILWKWAFVIYGLSEDLLDLRAHTCNSGPRQVRMGLLDHVNQLLHIVSFQQAFATILPVPHPLR
ncbi:MAG: hypothetical protein Q8O00_05295 [Holophaga sp.]|nr:hypothetical protein [Holophaga sp.]